MLGTSALCAAGTALQIPPMADVQIVALTTEDTRRFACGLVALKGEIGARLLRAVTDETFTFDLPFPLASGARHVNFYYAAFALPGRPTITRAEFRETSPTGRMQVFGFGISLGYYGPDKQTFFSPMGNWITRRSSSASRPARGGTTTTSVCCDSATTSSSSARARARRWACVTYRPSWPRRPTANSWR